MVGLIILGVVTIIAMMWVNDVDKAKKAPPEHKDLFNEDDKNAVL